ncbi:unnamed protein product [Schistosoma spindalis]|nr:unnamed protein product [Schistosoma spindale]
MINFYEINSSTIHLIHLHSESSYSQREYDHFFGFVQGYYKSFKRCP